MAKRNKSKAVAVEAVEVVEVPVEVIAAKPVRSSRLRLPVDQARAHNAQWSLTSPAPTAAVIAGTVKGSNPKRARVYGYNNLANGGGVPKVAIVKVVGAVCPAAVNPGQWSALVAAVTANPSSTVESLRGQGIASRTLRRAFRNGGIQFVQ